MPSYTQLAGCVFGKRQPVTLARLVHVKLEHRHLTSVILCIHQASHQKQVRTRHGVRTRLVPSYNDQIVLPSKEATLVPSENGKFKPDFCTRDETAAEPSVLR